MMNVRPAEPADAAELADLLNAVIARGGTTALEEPYSASQLEREFITSPQVLSCFVAVDQDAIAGFQAVVIHDELPADIGDIATFARLGQAQRGVGSALFGATRARAVELGLSAINAVIRADNAGGLAYYARQGFIDHGVFEAVPLADGTPVDRIVKRCVITPHVRIGPVDT